MISSVIARLSNSTALPTLLAQLSDHEGIEVGELVNQNSLPMTIEAGSPDELEQIHNWIRELPTVEFVDVVFVFLQDEPAASTGYVQGYIK